MAEPLSPEQTMNVDVVALCARSRRYRKELSLASSGNNAAMNQHDFRRAKANLLSLFAYLDYCQKQDDLDAPEYHGDRRMDMSARPPVVEVENESINDLQRIYELFEIELCNCPSSAQSAKFNMHDERRLRAVIQRAVDYLDQYIAKILPLDLPETQPSRPAVRSGASGVDVIAKS